MPCIDVPSYRCCVAHLQRLLLGANAYQRAVECMPQLRELRMAHAHGIGDREADAIAKHAPGLTQGKRGGWGGEGGCLLVVRWKSPPGEQHTPAPPWLLSPLLCATGPARICCVCA